MTEQNTCCEPSCCADEKKQASDMLQQDTQRQSIRDVYGKVANAKQESDCSGGAASCCGTSDDEAINTLISTRLGYSQADLDIVPTGADMGLGCGNPQAIADLQLGETVVDLGSGGGFDSFLASPQVGETGAVIGVDMTPDMISKARNNADKGNYSNVEFRLGEIEHLPIVDNTVDVIISNCVINLSPNKAQVFRDAYRVLKSGGRIAISDVVATMELSEEMKNDPQLIAGCMGNASLIDELQNMIAAAGFTDIEIKPKDSSREFIKDWAPDLNITDYVVSASIRGIKP